MRRYLTAGFYEKDDTIPLLLALQEGGADVSFGCAPITHSCQKMTAPCGQQAGDEELGVAEALRAGEC
jgi:hypothetical protein